MATVILPEAHLLVCKLLHQFYSRRNQSFDLLRISRDVTQNTADFSVKNQFSLFSLFVIFFTFVLRLLFTFSNFVYKTEQLKAHALLALETFCFDFFSAFENTNKNVNFRFEAQSLAEFTHFYHFYPQPRIDVSGTKVQNHDFKTLKVD